MVQRMRTGRAKSTPSSCTNQLRRYFPNTTSKLTATQGIIVTKTMATDRNCFHQKPRCSSRPQMEAKMRLGENINCEPSMTVPSAPARSSSEERPEICKSESTTARRLPGGKTRRKSCSKSSQPGATKATTPARKSRAEKNATNIRKATACACRREPPRRLLATARSRALSTRAGLREGNWAWTATAFGECRLLLLSR